MSIPFHKQTDPNKQAGQVVFCSCGDREKSQCPGEWEKGCDLGANPNHVVTIEPSKLLESVKQFRTEAAHVQDRLDQLGDACDS